MILKTMTAMLAFSLGTPMAATIARADQIVNDDLVVIGNVCVGFDCANGMAFADDPLVLRENNVRIGFGGAGEFRLVANESSIGGANEFRLDSWNAVSGSTATAVTAFDNTVSAAVATEMPDGSLRIDLTLIGSDIITLDDPTLANSTDSDLTVGENYVFIPAGEWTDTGFGQYSYNANVAVTSENGVNFSYS